MKALKLTPYRFSLTWKRITLPILALTCATLSASAAISVNYSLEENIIRLNVSGDMSCASTESQEYTIGDSAITYNSKFSTLNIFATDYLTSEKMFGYYVEGKNIKIEPSGASSKSCHLYNYRGMIYSLGVDSIEFKIYCLPNGYMSLQTNLGRYYGNFETLHIDATYVEYIYHDDFEALEDYIGITTLVGDGFRAVDANTGKCYFALNATPVPEPSTAVYVAAGGIATGGLVLRCRRRTRRKADDNTP